jgi:hypothetical protein
MLSTTYSQKSLCQQQRGRCWIAELPGLDVAEVGEGGGPCAGLFLPQSLKDCVTARNLARRIGGRPSRQGADALDGKVAVRQIPAGIPNYEVATCTSWSMRSTQDIDGDANWRCVEQYRSVYERHSVGRLK